MTIRARLLLSFGLLCVLMVTASVVGGHGTRVIVRTALQTMHGDLRLAQLATELRVNALQLRRFEKDVFINLSDPEKVREYRDKWQSALADTQQVRSDAAKLAQPDTRRSIEQLGAELETYASGFRVTIKSIESGSIASTAQANSAMGEYKQSVHQVDTLVSQIAEDAAAQAAKVDGIIGARSDSVLKTSAILSVVSLALALVLSLMITKSIVTPVRSAVQLARSVADGKLGHDFTVQQRDEIADLLHELSRMDRKLRDIIGEVNIGAGKVSSAAAGLAESNSQLSHRTQGQASSLEETAAAIEEMTAAIKANADSAANASQLARGASSVAAAGGEVVSSAVHAMAAINDSSRRISDIIAVIDEIAFQTNLLALNAAVEAARAGEQGRGFAVVAGEVRNLAQRSASAAKEIKTLIGDSVEKVRTGSALVSKSGEHLEQIVHSVQRVTTVVEEIASANAEQASGVSQLNDAVAQLDHITQQNAAGTEEIAAASQMMHAESDRLVETVSYFSIPGQSTTQAARHQQPAVNRSVVDQEPEIQARYGT